VGNDIAHLLPPKPFPTYSHPPCCPAHGGPGVNTKSPATQPLPRLSCRRLWPRWWQAPLPKGQGSSGGPVRATECGSRAVALVVLGSDGCRRGRGGRRDGQSWWWCDRPLLGSSNRAVGRSAVVASGAPATSSWAALGGGSCRRGASKSSLPIWYRLRVVRLLPRR
jgi:hypothetical protein